MKLDELIPEDKTAWQKVKRKLKGNCPSVFSMHQEAYHGKEFDWWDSLNWKIMGGTAASLVTGLSSGLVRKIAEHDVIDKIDNVMFYGGWSAFALGLACSYYSWKMINHHMWKYRGSSYINNLDE